MPGPIVNISKEINNISTGEQIEVTVTDPGFNSDIKSCETNREYPCKSY